MTSVLTGQADLLYFYGYEALLDETQYILQAIYLQNNLTYSWNKGRYEARHIGTMVTG